MATLKLDCKGLPCPQPVLKCKEASTDNNTTELTVIVDNAPANENVTRFLKTQGFEVESQAGEEIWTITANRESTQDNCDVCEVMSNEEISHMAAKTTVFITSEFLGDGDDDLGSKLMFNFLATLPEMQDELFRIVLVNGGVKIACEGHPCLEKLKPLADAGIMVLVCGTCLEHFDLLEKKQVGDTTNMLDVVTSLQAASKVIKI